MNLASLANKGDLGARIGRVKKGGWLTGCSQSRSLRKNLRMVRNGRRWCNDGVFGIRVVRPRTGRMGCSRAEGEEANKQSSPLTSEGFHCGLRSSRPARSPSGLDDHYSNVPSKLSAVDSYSFFSSRAARRRTRSPRASGRA